MEGGMRDGEFLKSGGREGAGIVNLTFEEGVWRGWSVNLTLWEGEIFFVLKVYRVVFYSGFCEGGQSVNKD